MDAVASELRGYRYFYLDDFEGQKLPFAKELGDLRSLTCVCNLFAVPASTADSEILEMFR